MDGVGGGVGQAVPLPSLGFQDADAFKECLLAGSYVECLSIWVYVEFPHYLQATHFWQKYEKGSGDVKFDRFDGL